MYEFEKNTLNEVNGLEMFYLLYTHVPRYDFSFEEKEG